MSEELLKDVLARVKRIEEAIVKQATIKAAYTTDEFANSLTLNRTQFGCIAAKEG